MLRLCLGSTKQGQPLGNMIEQKGCSLILIAMGSPARPCPDPSGPFESRYLFFSALRQDPLEGRFL